MAKLVLDFEKPIIELEQKMEEMRRYADNPDIAQEIVKIGKRVNQLQQTVYAGLTRWQRVQLARHPDRPYTLDYIGLMTREFIELHGDRYFRDDHAIVAGFARLDEKPVMIIGHQKGRDTKSNVYRNFGMPNPEGYRKALRLMKLAEKFRTPVVTLLDTPARIQAWKPRNADRRKPSRAICWRCRVSMCRSSSLLSVRGRPAEPSGLVWGTGF